MTICVFVIREYNTMKRLLMIAMAVVAVAVMSACKSGKRIVTADKSMLVGQWVTVSAEEQWSWNGSPMKTSTVDSTYYTYISLTIDEDYITAVMHDTNGDPVPPLNVLTRSIVGYSIDSNNVVKWSRTNRFRPKEWKIIKLTSNKLVFSYDCSIEDGIGTATYTMRRR